MTIKKTDEWTYIVEDDEGRFLARIQVNGAANWIEIDAEIELCVIVECNAGVQDFEARVDFDDNDHSIEVLRCRTLFDTVVYNWRRPY